MSESLSVIRVLLARTVQATTTLKHLAAALTDGHYLPKKQAETLLGDLVPLTTRHLE